jgi:hypothetical protein
MPASRSAKTLSALKILPDAFAADPDRLNAPAAPVSDRRTIIPWIG